MAYFFLPLSFLSSSISSLMACSSEGSLSYAKLLDGSMDTQKSLCFTWRLESPLCEQIFEEWSGTPSVC